MQTLSQSVVAGGRVFPAGTARDATHGVPSGSWWDDESPSATERRGGEPPRSGRGSNVEAWREYATSIGVEHTDADARDGIIAAVDAAN